jgi:hypothetical protein
MKDFPEPHSEGREGDRCEGGKEDEKGETANNLSAPIQRGLIVEGRGVFITDEKEDDHQQEPSEVVDETDEGDSQQGKTKNDLAVRSEEGVDDVPSIELSCG